MHAGIVVLVEDVEVEVVISVELEVLLDVVELLVEEVELVVELELVVVVVLVVVTVPLDSNAPMSQWVPTGRRNVRTHVSPTGQLPLAGQLVVSVGEQGPTHACALGQAWPGQV